MPTLGSQKMSRAQQNLGLLLPLLVEIVTFYCETTKRAIVIKYWIMTFIFHL